MYTQSYRRFKNLLCLGGAVLALVGANSSARAAVIASNNAVAAVRGWLKADPRPLGEPVPPVIEKVETVREASGDVLYHVVSLRPSGFVVISGDDLMEPVVAFSKSGRFDKSPSNPLGALVAGDLAGRKGRVRGVQPTALTGELLRTRQKWQLLVESAQPNVTANAIGTVSDVRVAPFVQSRWGQETTIWGVALYNYYTPPFAAGSPNNYPAGCVATALGQMLRFFQYPTTGVGTSSFPVTVDGITTNMVALRGGDGKGGPYVWSNMPFASQTPSVAQCQAIGALIADCGAVVQMNYYSDGSSAYVTYAKNALVQTFKYSNAIDGRNSSYTNIGAPLTNMMNPNLDARYPVVLGVSGAPGGHALVCDGYGYSGATMYHHLNLGWTGSDDAWYALPIIDTSLGAFTNLQECIYNVYTNGAGEIISGRVVDRNGLPIAGCTITATRNKGGTYTATTDTNGIYALAKIPSASNYSIKATKTGYASVTASYSTGTSADVRFTDTVAKTGNYWGANFSLSSFTPSNDLCSGAILISGTSATNLQSTVGATSAGDPVPFCQTNFGGGVWYKYVPASDGQLKLDTVGSSFATVLGLYSGSCGALTATDCNDDAVSGSALADIVAAGTTYYILVGGEGGATGDLVLHLTFNAPASLTVQASPTNAGTVSGGGTFIPGTLNQISAMANAGWYFSHWQDGSVQNPRTITMPAGGCTNTAYFYAVPQMIAPSWSNDAVSLSVSCSVGSAIRVDVSKDLVNWTTLTTLTNSTGQVQFSAPTATNSSLFYRAVGLQ